jgi:hypothetical protein
VGKARFFPGPIRHTRVLKHLMTQRRKEKKFSDQADLDPVYRGIIKRLESKPYVQQRLDQLCPPADENKILLMLASCAFQHYITFTRHIAKDESKLADLAKELYSLAKLVDELIDEEKSPLRDWVEKMGLTDEVDIGWDKPPSDTVEEMRRYALWLDRNVKGMSLVRESLEVVDSGKGVMRLMEYVKFHTGKYHDALLAELLNAAIDSADEVFTRLGKALVRPFSYRLARSSGDGEYTFSKVALKKFRQRHRVNRKMSSQIVAGISDLFLHPKY